jgi:hypothetical protein
MLDRVAAIRHAEAELENKVLEEAGAEKVTLDHCEILHRPVAHRKLDPTCK